MIYVAGFLKDSSHNLLLVRKTHPEWQRGRLNGIGGAVEAGETPLQAMIREWREETGEDRRDWHHFCHLAVNNGVKVYFFRSLTNERIDRKWHSGQLNDAGEELVVVNANFINKLYVIENLRWLLPMAFDDPSRPSATVKCYEH